MKTLAERGHAAAFLARKEALARSLCVHPDIETALAARDLADLSRHLEHPSQATKYTLDETFPVLIALLETPASDENAEFLVAALEVVVGAGPRGWWQNRSTVWRALCHASTDTSEQWEAMAGVLLDRDGHFQPQLYEALEEGLPLARWDAFGRVVGSPAPMSGVIHDVFMRRPALRREILSKWCLHSPESLAEFAALGELGSVEAIAILSGVVSRGHESLPALAVVLPMFSAPDILGALLHQEKGWLGNCAQMRAWPFLEMVGASYQEKAGAPGPWARYTKQALAACLPYMLSSRAEWLDALDALALTPQSANAILMTASPSSTLLQEVLAVPFPDPAIVAELLEFVNPAERTGRPAVLALLAGSIDSVLSPGEGDVPHDEMVSILGILELLMVHGQDPFARNDLGIDFFGQFGDGPAKTTLLSFAELRLLSSEIPAPSTTPRVRI